MEKVAKLNPSSRYYTRKPEHPGAFLSRCYLKPLGLSQSDLAKAMGVSRRRVNEVINGQRAITADTALRLARCLHTTPMFWLEKQQLWELYLASRSLSNAPAIPPPLRHTAKSQ